MKEVFHRGNSANYLKITLKKIALVVSTCYFLPSRHMEDILACSQQKKPFSKCMLMQKQKELLIKHKQKSNRLQRMAVSYLLKTFFSSREREVLACCFRSVRFGYFCFFPFFFCPFPLLLEEPRSSPVAASTSLMNSGSLHSVQKTKHEL